MSGKEISNASSNFTHGEQPLCHFDVHSGTSGITAFVNDAGKHVMMSIPGTYVKVPASSVRKHKLQCMTGMGANVPNAERKETKIIHGTDVNAPNVNGQEAKVIHGTDVNALNVE